MIFFTLDLTIILTMKPILYSVFLVGTLPLFAQSKGFKLQPQTVVAKASTSAVGGSNSSFSRVDATPDKSAQLVATLDVTADLTGTLYVNEKYYTLTNGVKQSIAVPKNFSYYFVTKDEKFSTPEERKALRPHEVSTPVKLTLNLQEDYNKMQADKEQTAYFATILRGIFGNMTTIQGGELPAQKGRAKQFVRDFDMSKYEVTVQEFEAFVQNSKKIAFSDDKESLVLSAKSLQKRTVQKGVNWSCDAFGNPRTPEQSQQPVVHVSWQEAIEFCNWLSAKDKNYEYRLPSRAEWEFAAGCGAQATEFAWNTEGGVEVYANTADATLRRKLPLLEKGTLSISDGFALTAPVGSYLPNCFGLYDMIGNAAEWCQDVFVNDEKDNKDARIYKGGSYFTPAENCAILKNYGWQGRHGGIGFRVCRVRK